MNQEGVELKELDQRRMRNGTLIGQIQPNEWIEVVVPKNGGKSWNELSVAQKRDKLLSLHNEDHKQFEAVVGYIITKSFHNDCIDDMESDHCLLVKLPTSLAVEVLRSKYIPPLALKHVPNLMRQGIPSQKLKTLLLFSQQLRREEQDNNNNPESSNEGQIRNGRGTIAPDSATHVHGTLCVGKKSKYIRYHSIPVTTAKEFTDLVEEMLHKRCHDGCKYLDNCFQGVLSCSGVYVNLNECVISYGTVLHAAAYYGLSESAKEILNQGYYNMLLVNYEDTPNTWPLVFAVQEEQWATVKVILDTLNFSQRQVQIRVLLEQIPYKQIVQNVSQYKKPWWPLSILHRPDLEKKLRNDGRVELLKAVLDTTVKGCEVDPSLLFNKNEKEKRYDGHHGTDEIDHCPRERDVVISKPIFKRSIVHDKTKKSFFRLISETDVEELKNHPSFTTIVQHKWLNYHYNYCHGILSICYVLYLIFFMVALVLAAHSSDPRVYDEGLDFLRLSFEIVCFFYLLTVFVIDTVLFTIGVRRYFKARQKFLDFFLEMANPYSVFEVLRYLTTLLIIPLRITNDPNQWWMASIAIILSGLRLFTYATVLPFMGKFVGVLILIVKHDLPRLFGVFVILNFSFGSGLYFALVGHHNNGHIDEANENVTSEVYRLWLTGVQMVIEGSVLTYIDNDGFNVTGRIIYWMFVFSVTIAFAAVLIAQFQISFQTLTERAKLQTTLKKCNIMRKMDQFFEKSPHDWIKRSTLNGSDESETKDYAIAELSRKVAENNEQVKTLTEKLETVLQHLHQAKRTNNQQETSEVV